MAMTKQGADKAVITSALVVFGVYFYRHLSEGTTTQSGGVGQLLGFGTPANIGKFVTAWGFTFFILSLVAQAAPGFGGSFAILVATGDVLANSAQVAKDVNTKLSAASSGSSAASSASNSAGTSGTGVVGNTAPSPSSIAGTLDKQFNIALTPAQKQMVANAPVVTFPGYHYDPVSGQEVPN